MDRCYRESYANVHRGVYTIAEEATTAYEGGAHEDRALLERAVAERDRVHQERHRGDQPRRLLVGARRTCTRATRSCSPRWSTTPTSSRGTSSPPSAASSCAGSRSPTTTASTSPTSTGCSTAPSCWRSPRPRTCSARSTTIRPLADAAHAAGALVLVDAAQAVPHLPVDVQAWDADFVGFTGHKMLGPSGDRRAVGPRRAARRDAAVPRRRRDDPRRDRRRASPPTRSPGSSRPAPRRSPRPSVSARPSTTSRRSGLDAVRAHEKSLTGYALDALDDRFGDR